VIAYAVFILSGAFSLVAMRRLRGTTPSSSRGVRA
jgi:hypothetical protein